MSAELTRRVADLEREVVELRRLVASFVRARRDGRPRQAPTRRARGVYRTRNGRWAAKIQIGLDQKHLGTFDNELDAARAYAAARDSGVTGKAKRDGVPEPLVYVVRNDVTGHIKIGVSIDPPSRLRALSTGADHQLSLLFVLQGGYARERYLHRTFAECRVRGEWFRPSPELAAWLASNGVAA